MLWLVLAAIVGALLCYFTLVVVSIDEPVADEPDDPNEIALW